MAGERAVIDKNLAELDTLLLNRTGQLIFAGSFELGHLYKMWLAIAASGQTEVKAKKVGAGNDIRVPASMTAFKDLRRPDLGIKIACGPLVLSDRRFTDDQDKNPAGVFKGSTSNFRLLLMIGDSLVRGWFEGQTTEYTEELDVNSDELAFVKKPRCKNPKMLILYLSMLNALNKPLISGWESETLKSHREELVQELNRLHSGKNYLESIPESLKISIKGCAGRLVLVENFLQGDL